MTTDYAQFPSLLLPQCFHEPNGLIIARIKKPVTY